ncbi:hypothetical protein KMS41_20020 [Ochrobactrum sp. BTU1]|nr:hypothetical protein KMS41_20020 [Ochrobactrum sp. BTU1]
MENCQVYRTWEIISIAPARLHSTLLAVALFRSKSIYQIDHGEEAAARAVAYERPGIRDSQAALAGGAALTDQF